jgi:hypothetical protein
MYIETIYLQAAASGQPDIAFAPEEKTPGDRSREDIRGLIRGQPRAPNEVKRGYARSTLQDNGINKNSAPISKVSQIFLLWACLMLICAPLTPGMLSFTSFVCFVFLNP